MSLSQIFSVVRHYHLFQFVFHLFADYFLFYSMCVSIRADTGIGSAGGID